MSNKISFSNDAREKLVTGVDKLSKAVTATLGPSGRNVIIEQKQGFPQSTKDGVTVAKSIQLEDIEENIGAQLVKQASIKTADAAGDGTTTSTLLASSIYKKGLEASKEPTVNLVDLKRGIDKATTKVIDTLEEVSKEITDEEQLKQIATISANNDPEVGELISTAMDKVGRDGVVTIEESKTGDTYLETVEGMQFDRGYKSPYFVTDNSSMQAVLQNPLILITDKKLTQVKELLPILEGCSNQNKSLLIIADDIDGEALSTLVVNKMRGILGCVAVKAPQFGDRKKAMLEDIAILTNGTVVSSEKGMRLDKFQPDWLGSAKKVTVGKDSTTIIDANGDQEKIENRVKEIQDQIDNTNSPYEKETLQDRLAKFIGGVAIVYVGGMTEVEMKERKDRVDDALHATKAALEEGFLPGGGIALLKASKRLYDDPELWSYTENENEAIGFTTLLESCAKPFEQILENAGIMEVDINAYRKEVETNKNKWLGFNTRTNQYVDMFKEGLIDPTKVTRLALENAASVAGTMLTTEALVTNIKEENAPAVPGIDPSMMMQ